MQVNVGTCRRYPPSAIPGMMQVARSPANPQGLAPIVQGHFPPIGASEWCGEFSPKITTAN
ncbi:MAG: hypothetical protein RML32_14140 [Gammaproteobacteria bacterium]|nr:hypothetical protein [Gammaproteobacteria bacterium]